MDSQLFLSPALDVAPRLLGGLLSVNSPQGQVTVRITEVEAYHGLGTEGPYDPGAHSKDRKTPRNASMFGPPGHAYVYLSYGIHFALNLVCSPESIASAVLIRAGEVVQGIDLARQRRSVATEPTNPPRKSTIADAQLARGPGNLGKALGITRDTHDGLSLFADPFEIQLPPQPPERVARGPRVGVAGVAGSTEFPWRFWIPNEPSVSSFRPGRNAPAWVYDPSQHLINGS